MENSLAKVIDVDKFLLVRDTEDFIHVFAFFPEGIIKRRLMNIVREGAKIYFQCQDDETYVGNNHPGFYGIPENMLDDFKEIIISQNYQTLPWEKL
jgi:hypothetical protein